MARIVLPVAGAIVGFYLGGTAGAQYGWLAGSIVAGVVGTQTRRSVKINETGAQTTTEGAPRAIVYGACVVTGNLIDTGPIRIVETTEEAKGGGGPSQTTRNYFRTYAVRICEGPTEALLVAKRDGKVVWDVRPGSTFTEENAAFLQYGNVFHGGEAQLPSASLEAIHGVGEVPAHRGSSYIVFTDDDLTGRQGSVPQWEFVIASDATPDDVVLTPRTSASVAGEFGGGTFGAPGHSVDSTFDASVSGVTGSAFLAFFAFDPTGGPFEVEIFFNIGGVTVFTEVVPISAVETRRIQVNHALDNTAFTIGWLGAFTGNFAISLQGVPGNAGDPMAPIRPATPSEPYILVTSTEEDFGVVRNSTDYEGAQFTTQYGTHWRVDMTYEPGTYTPDTVLLSEIVTDIHERCIATVPDVAELTDEVAGLVFGSADYSGADAIETLRTPYLFDRAEYDGQIHYPKRGADSVATITFDDLVELPDESQRESHPEYPRKLHLSYQAVQVNYEIALSTSDRYSTDERVVGEQSLQVPVVLGEEEAANITARLHKVAWADAEGDVKFSLPIQWIGLTPSECIDLDLRGRVRRLRIEGIEDANGERALTCRIDRQTAYLSEAPSFIPLPTPPAPPSIAPGTTTLAVMDISALREVDDILLNYVAGSSGAGGWRGYQLQRSLDAGVTFEAVSTFTTAAVIGTLQDYVATAAEWYTDTTNTVRVALLRDGQELTSISDLAFVQRGGAFALEKSDGSWEIMQYLDAALDSDGVYTLSTLHRGQLNSGPDEHLVGAKFVLLSGSRIEPTESAWIATDIVHRAPSIGQSPEDAAEQTQTYVGRSQTEWPVASLVLARDLDDIITASWAPRHRLGSDVAPVASINFEGYRITLDDGFTEVTFDQTAASFTYDAGALSTDPISVTVQALNRFTGAGPATTDSI